MSNCRNTVQVANRAVDHQSGAGLLHDVVGKVVSDERAVFIFAEQIDNQNVTGLQLVDDPLILAAAVAFLFALPSDDSFRSPRTGMNCAVTTRPTSFLAGLRDLEPAGKVVREAFTRKNAPDILCRKSLIFWSAASGTFGRPSSKRSNGFFAVSLTI